MNVSVGTSPVELDLSDYPDVGDTGQRVTLQNLGPGVVYFDGFDDVSASTGVKLDVDGYWELVIVRPTTLYLVADQVSTDVRFFVVD